MSAIVCYLVSYVTSFPLLESRQPQRLIYRPDLGVEIVEWLHRLVSVPTPRWAEVRVYGTARSVELRSMLSRGQAQRLTGTIELLDVRGMVGPQGTGLRGQLVLEQKQLLSGEILRLSGDSLVLAIDLLGDLQPLADAPSAQPPAPPEPTSGGNTWGDVLAASVSQDEDDESTGGADVVVKVGDFLDHPKFGRCRVDRIEGDQRFATVRTPGHRMLRLSLEVLDLRIGGREGDRRIWKVLAAGADK